ncbi:hypothetical protein ABS71_03300 [bacterium SCN 62-11]|nr:hypothetical protein [Candidatus Eremiobacteraeota bacterium]ODT76533.1 MAG: hypothetical protein ABS71_03300 [bacterium SCN 62-11]
MRSFFWVLLLGCSAWAATKEFLTGRSENSASVTVTGYADHSGWLGITVTPTSDRYPARSQVIYVRQGNWQQTFPLGSNCSNAKYEVALWESKVAPSQCKTKDCKWCKANGYHMDGLRSYASGTVAR